MIRMMVLRMMMLRMMMLRMMMLRMMMLRMMMLRMMMLRMMMIRMMLLRDASSAGHQCLSGTLWGSFEYFVVHPIADKFQKYAIALQKVRVRASARLAAHLCVCVRLRVS